MFSGYKSQQIGLQDLSVVGLVRQHAVFLKKEKTFLHSEHLHSSSAHYVTLPKYFSHPSFSYVLFCNPHETEIGIANKWGTTNSEPPGPIIMMGESETLSSNLITLFSEGVKSCCASYQPWEPVELC